MPLLISVCFAAIRVAFLSPDVAAQATTAGRAAEAATYCEDAQALLDNATIEALKDRDGHIILLARLGDGEGLRDTNAKRLSALGNYLSRRATNGIVVAQGERTKGAGRVEVYVRGRRFAVLRFPRGELIDCSGI